jgi:glycosyltransferase involved in cell wall biosynthesis
MYRILHVTNSLGTGGAERLLVDIARLIDRGRFSMSVCCTGPDGPAREALERAGCDVTVLDRTRRSSVLLPLFCADVLRIAAGIVRTIRKVRPHVVHSHLEANYIAPYCAKASGVRGVVSSFHSSVLFARRGKYSLRNAARRAVLRGVGRTADFLVAGSRFAAASAAAACGVPGDRVRVIHNAVDVSLMERTPASPRIREELGLAKETRLVATLGTLKEPKNHGLLIRGMSLLCRERSDVACLIIGRGPEEYVKKLIALRDQLGLESKVFLLGYRRDAYAILKACDLMVLPSLWEGLPVAALEAMACRVAVLLSDIPPHRELVENGTDGWLFRSGDEAALAEKMSRALERPDLRLRLAAAGFEKVRTLYDSERMVRRYEDLYAACAAGDGPARGGEGS